MLIPWSNLYNSYQYKTFHELWMDKSKFLTARLHQIATNFLTFRKSASDANIDRIQYYQKTSQETNIDNNEFETEQIIDEENLENIFEHIENSEQIENNSIDYSNAEMLGFFQQACGELRKLWQIDQRSIQAISQESTYYWNDLYTDN